LRKLIRKSITVEFEELKSGNKEIIITVSNLSKNAVEYKSLKDFDYAEFCDWISCNYSFMSLVKKNDCDYGDGGFTNLVPIRGYSPRCNSN
jgi:hypothetical protein